MEVFLRRSKQTDTYTIGTIECIDGMFLAYTCNTLELPWKGNQRRISCVPSGRYMMVYEWSRRFNAHLWELKDVPERSEVKIHNGNYTRQILGCILVGRSHADIDGDGVMDVTSSRPTLKDFHEILEPFQHESVYITISDPPDGGLYADKAIKGRQKGA